MMSCRLRLGLTALAAFLSVGTASCAQESGDRTRAETPDADNVYASLPMRMIGPAHSSGRIADFAFDPDRKSRFFVATASSGVWRTENAGTTWTPIFDHEGSYATGDVEMSPSNSNEIWVGTGENNNQRSVGAGDGVYKSVNGGESWTRVGLENAGHIGQIRFHPTDPKTVFVAAIGPLWSEGGDRGFYKTSDGGETWEKLLDVDPFTGANEFVVHPQNPDLMIVSAYERYRRTWSVINGGPGSAVYRTTDGGVTWEEIGNGLPTDIDMGRIAFGWSTHHPDVVYASVVGQDDVGGIYYSDDFGATWEKRSDRGTNDSAYYGELTVDPNDPDHAILIDTFSWETFDGGYSWEQMGYDNRHVDDHAIWFDPDDSLHMYIGSDGGIYETWDGGETFRRMLNLPLTQFYRLEVDNAAPFYNVCAGTQDNNTLCGPSRTNLIHGIVNADWEIVLGGDGFEPQIDPDDPNIIYAQYQYAGLVRYDRRTTERVSITPQPQSGEMAFNWNWNSPLLISPHNSKRLYFGAEKIFRSDDRGDSWTAISGDLSRGVDRNLLDVGDRVWSVDAVRKNYWTSFYGSTIAFDESPLQADLLYVGTDDGMIHVTENGGEEWRSLSRINGVPEMTYVEKIIASVHDSDRAYAVFDNHKRGDFTPYVMKTEDRGRTWSPIDGDLPGRGTVHTIAEDHVDPDLLFVGTEYGVFYTQDGGGHWHELTNLPTISVRDIEIQRRESDLVIATFGRSIYVLDDYAPLRTKMDDLSETEATSFPVRDPFIYVEGDRWGGYSTEGKGDLGDAFFNAPNPPFGAVISYYLRDGYETKRDARRDEERAIEDDRGDTPYPSWDNLRAEDREIAPTIVATVRDNEGAVVRRIKGPVEPGFHQIVWDLQHAPFEPIADAEYNHWAINDGGPLVAPGVYSVQLSKVIDREEIEIGEPQTFTVKSLGLSPEEATGTDRDELVAFQSTTAELARVVSGADEKLSELKTRVDSLRQALFVAPAATAEDRSNLTALDDQLYAIDLKLNGDDTISSRFERTPWSLDARVSSIIDGHWGSLSPVTGVHRDALAIAEAEAATVLRELSRVDEDIAAFESGLEDKGIPWTSGRVPVLKE
ncbi:MAG: glycosyl hydrolase [Pseudomonadota bacterium]